MAETLRGGLSLAASGFAYWSHDIGGFEGTPDAGVFKRWLAFGLLSSHSRLHGSDSYRVPWAFDDEAVDVARRFTELKMSLMPYLARLADRCTASGTPMLRPMVLEFPDDPAVRAPGHPVHARRRPAGRTGFPADGTVRFYVPEGRWTSLLDGLRGHRPAAGQQQHHAYDSLPVLVRPGTVLPIGARGATDPDYHYADDIALHVYGVEALRHSTVRIPGTDDIDDSVFDVEFNDGTLTVSRTSGPEVSWSVVLPAGSRPASATGGRLESTSDGGHRIATSEGSVTVELLA